jgi:hypothetical protein
MGQIGPNFRATLVLKRMATQAFRLGLPNEYLAPDTLIASLQSP